MSDRLIGKARGFGERGFRAGFNELGGFRKFILRGNVVDLAVGVVIGAAFTGIVSALVADIFTPLIGLIGVHDFSNLHYTSPNGNDFKFGAVINAAIAFLITAAVVYFCVVRPVAILQERFLPHHEEEPTTRDCPYCLSAVPLKATRCAFCTSQLSPVEVPSTARRSQ